MLTDLFILAISTIMCNMVTPYNLFVIVFLVRRISMALIDLMCVIGLDCRLRHNEVYGRKQLRYGRSVYACEFFVMFCSVLFFFIFDIYGC